MATYRNLRVLRRLLPAAVAVGTILALSGCYYPYGYYYPGYYRAAPAYAYPATPGYYRGY